MFTFGLCYNAFLFRRGSCYYKFYQLLPRALRSCSPRANKQSQRAFKRGRIRMLSPRQNQLSPKTRKSQNTRIGQKNQLNIVDNNGLTRCILECQEQRAVRAAWCDPGPFLPFQFELRFSRVWFILFHKDHQATVQQWCCIFLHWLHSHLKYQV